MSVTIKNTNMVKDSTVQQLHTDLQQIVSLLGSGGGDGGGASNSGMMKNIYFNSGFCGGDSTGWTLQYQTPDTITWDTSKTYEVRITYSFQQGEGDGTTPQTLQFSLRDENQATLSNVHFSSANAQKQCISLDFQFVPQMSSSKLAFLASSGAQITNNYNDIIVFNIKQIL
jgi:hypothetical protein